MTQTFVAAEASALVALGHAVRIGAASPQAGAPDNAGLPVHHVWSESTPQRLRAMALVAARHPWRCARDLIDRRRWRAEEVVPPLRTLAPSILRLQATGAMVHAHFATAPALRALRVSRILGRPWTLTAHAYDIYAAPANLPEKLREAAVVTSGCAYTVAELRRQGAPDPHEIVMGVDAGSFARRRPPPGGRAILAVGRLVPKKGFGDLLAALARPELASATLCIVGDGPQAPDLRRMITRLGLAGRVRLEGELDAAGVRGALEAADVLAMPCVIAPGGDRDSMPVVVKEAMAMELPVVVSDVVGLPELVTAGTGRIAAAGDPGALAAALAGVLDLDASARAAIGAAGRARVMAFAGLRAETARLSGLLRAVHPSRQAGRHP